MNILTTSFNKDSFETALRSDGGCVHVRRFYGETISEEELRHSSEPNVRDISPPYAVFKEDDSFGPVGRYVACRSCYTSEKEADLLRIVRCDDCKQPKPKGETRAWRWYDFYAAQGDEAMTICHECWDGPKHKARCAEDEADRRAEMARDVWDD